MKTILIAEDDSRLSRLLQYGLSEFYQTLPAANGQEAVNLATHHMPDLVVMDVIMPVMDGMEALRRLKDNPDTANIPVILLSVLHKDVLPGRKYQADCYMTKPFKMEELQKSISRFIDGQLA